MSTQVPKPLLQAIVKRLEASPPWAGLCAGHEAEAWRFDQLAEHLIEWLPEFALNDREYDMVAGYNARRAMRRAAEAVYKSENYAKRGEVGEILLHAIIRLEFGSEPLVSKIYFLDAPNDTVKGFDAVHIVQADDGLELWLGEVKLYQDAPRAVRDVVEELHRHTKIPYLRTEFAAICKKISPGHPHHQAVTDLLDENTSMDRIFTRVCVPVLLTYDSTALSAHTKSDDDYRRAILAEFEQHHERFANSGLPQEVKIVLILVPTNTKAELLASFDRKLKGQMT